MAVNIDIYIKGEKIDLLDSSQVLYTYDYGDILEPTAIKISTSNKFNIPTSAHNIRLLDGLSMATVFKNGQVFPVEVYVNGMQTSVKYSLLVESVEDGLFRVYLKQLTYSMLEFLEGTTLKIPANPLPLDFGVKGDGVSGNIVRYYYNDNEEFTHGIIENTTLVAGIGVISGVVIDEYTFGAPYGIGIIAGIRERLKSVGFDLEIDEDNAELKRLCIVYPLQEVKEGWRLYQRRIWFKPRQELWDKFNCLEMLKYACVLFGLEIEQDGKTVKLVKSIENTVTITEYVTSPIIKFTTDYPTTAVVKYADLKDSDGVDTLEKEYGIDANYSNAIISSNGDTEGEKEIFSIPYPAVCKLLEYRRFREQEDWGFVYRSISGSDFSIPDYSKWNDVSLSYLGIFNNKKTNAGIPYGYAESYRFKDALSVDMLAVISNPVKYEQEIIIPLSAQLDKRQIFAINGRLILATKIEQQKSGSYKLEGYLI